MRDKNSAHPEKKALRYNFRVIQASPYRGTPAIERHVGDDNLQLNKTSARGDGNRLRAIASTKFLHDVFHVVDRLSSCCGHVAGRPTVHVLPICARSVPRTYGWHGPMYRRVPGSFESVRYLRYPLCSRCASFRFPEIIQLRGVSAPTIRHSEWPETSATGNAPEGRDTNKASKAAA